MINFPPVFLKPLKSGLSVPITFPYISTDCWNNRSNWSYVVVVQSQVGFCWTHVPRYCSTSGKGAPIALPPLVVVFARPLNGFATGPANGAPHVKPYQRKLPLVVRGPATILATTSAS